MDLDGLGSEADWAKEAKFWKSAGATHLCPTTTFHRRHHHRLAGTSVTDHVAALQRYHAVAAGGAVEPIPSLRAKEAIPLP